MYEMIDKLINNNTRVLCSYTSSTSDYTEFIDSLMILSVVSSQFN
jgi:hypothetical protein